MKMTFEQMMQYLRSLEFSDFDIAKLLKLSTKEKIKEAKLHQYEKDYQATQKR